MQPTDRANEIDLRDTDDGHGRQADAPTQIPARGWRDVAVRVNGELKEDNATILAGGIAFFAMLSLFPALTALLSLYGLLADPADVARQVQDLGQTLPEEARQLITDQLGSIAGGGQGALSIGLAVSLVVALWSASSATKQLLVALSTAYDETESRGFVKLRLLAAGLTIAGIVAMGAFLFVITALPGVASNLVGDAGSTAVSILRWPVLIVLMVLALSFLYRTGPDRDNPRWRWVSAGSIAATVLWLLGSLAFSFYASNFASYDKSYGTLASVVVLMLWLYLTSFCVILGAEINSELEHQTYRDSTVGPDRPMGQRDAEVADTVGPTSEEARRERQRSRT